MEENKPRSTSTTPLKVLIFPWIAHGHVTPFLELAKHLSKRNFKIYFYSTPIVLNFIKENQSIVEHNIELVELHLPSMPNLPSHHHTTNGLPKNLLKTLYDAFKLSSTGFLHVLDSCDPDLLICDGFQPWATTMALSRNIPSINFVIVGASSYSYGYHNSYLYKGRKPFPFPEIYLNDDEAKKEKPAMDPDIWFKPIENSSEILLINTCDEIEGKYIDYLSKMCKKKVVPIGPLIRVVEGDNSMIMEWLDNKEECSSVYVSFGSEYFLSKEDMKEMAYGLELSGVNFIWVIRFGIGEEMSIEEALPKGFLDRVKGRGVIVEWAPQSKILGHKNICGFLSHCGWNSAMESMYFGVPIIALPMHLDQPAHARMVVELGTALEIQREDNGMLRREEISKAIQIVVVEETGEKLRGRVKELSKKIKMKSEKRIDEAVDELTRICKKYRKQPIDNYDL